MPCLTAQTLKTSDPVQLTPRAAVDLLLYVLQQNRAVIDFQIFIVLCQVMFNVRIKAYIEYK